ncbi:MAG: acyltransferase family protein [Bacteroidales bacterium]|nr:acyltransferase family protein [Bacteroidales bacterium]
MLTHCCEPFYLGGEGSLILTKTDAIWVSILNVLPRAAVALFIIASSYLQFPLHYDAKEFFRRRAARILIPFFFWTVIYALVWGEPVQNFKDLMLNFNYAAGHLWFVYMIVGIYLLMPLLTPWAEKVSKKELQFYLAIWLFTTLIPLIRGWVGGPAPVIYGPSGIPNPAKFPLWGEASWNTYGLFYYLSGFIGYLMLGLYFRRFVGELSWKKTLSIALPLFIIGFTICSLGFLSGVWHDSNGIFPIEGPVGLAAIWEVPWLNDGAGIALMTIAWVLLFRKITTGGWFYEKILLPVSNSSYGMYLCHMLLLSAVSAWIRSSLGLGSEGIMGIWTTPVQILSGAIISFIGVAIFCVLVRRIPKVGKWIIG